MKNSVSEQIQARRSIYRGCGMLQLVNSNAGRIPVA